jgi:hypothetical protein
MMTTGCRPFVEHKGAATGRRMSDGLTGSAVESRLTTICLSNLAPSSSSAPSSNFPLLFSRRRRSTSARSSENQEKFSLFQSSPSSSVL